MSAASNVRVIDAASAPSLATLLDQLSRMEDAATSQSIPAINSARVHTFVNELTSHIPPSSPPDLPDLFADVGYDILHSLLPLLSPDSLCPPATKAADAEVLTVRLVADDVLTCTVLYGSPREVFLPLQSHLSAHITPLAQQQEEKQQQHTFDERKQPPHVQQPQASIPYVSFFLPYFVCLLQREKHATRQASMLKSLSSLLAAFFAALPTDEALAAILLPLQPLLQSANEVHVGLLLSLLSSYLPPHYPLPSPQLLHPVSLLLSLLPDTTSSAIFNLAALTTYLRRRQQLTQQLTSLREQSWELTEDEEQLTHTQHQTWHATTASATAADDHDVDIDSDDDQQQDEQERARRAELRHTKAELAALPPYPPAGIVCLLLLNLQQSDAEGKREVEALVRGSDGGVAGLRLYVDVMLGTEMAGRHRQVLIDVMYRWLSLIPRQSLHYTPIPISAAAISDPTQDGSWMLAECITTLMMQPSALRLAPSRHESNTSAPTATSTSPTASALLQLYLSRFTPAARFTLTTALIPACPFPAVQAILISTLKDGLLSHGGDGGLQDVCGVVDWLVEWMVSGWLSETAIDQLLDRVDGLIAVLNVLRFALLPFVGGSVDAQQLSDEKRRRIVAVVRLIHQRVSQAEQRESKQAGDAVDLPLLLLKDLTTRVLELT